MSTAGRAVLQAPPGAGKTTRVPLALLEETKQGKILMLEPRRIAARAAAEHMSALLSEPVGKTVGYRIKGETKIGPQTRIEVLTEGILTRMIQSDPELPGVSTIIFDEFHERALAADLGLALTWEVRQSLREDLRILVMSATLDAGPVATHLDNAPIITAEGRSFPVDIRHLPRPLPKPKGRDGLAQQTADLVTQAEHETEGGILVFLPGEAEIRKTETLLKTKLPEHCVIRPLLAALPFAQQKLALVPEPDPNKRKIVLATSIAETSLTIQDVRVVVDCGKSRRARFDPATGLSRLVTDPVSRAEAVQRTGRAGRVAPGISYRLWSKAEEGALPAFAPAEIQVADLASFALDVAAWGTPTEELALLTQPPPGQWAAAQNLLNGFEAISDGRITPYGRDLATVPTHPRLAHMILQCGEPAVRPAVLLSDMRHFRSSNADLTSAFGTSAGGTETKATQAEIKRLLRFAKSNQNYSFAQILAKGFPDRVAMKRPGDGTRYLLSGGQGAFLSAEDKLLGSAFLVVPDMQVPMGKTGTDPTIRAALPIAEAEIREIFQNQIELKTKCVWSSQHGKVLAEQTETFGALALTKQKWKAAPKTEISKAMLEGIRQIGIFPSKAARLFQARVARARAVNLDFPDVSDQALLDTLEDWLLPFLDGVSDAAGWKRFDILPALQAILTWDQTNQLNQLVPATFSTPLGRQIKIDYSGDVPEIALRLQELFGQTVHPTVAGEPLKVILLSPAQRPIQVTMDIPGFWSGSYGDVRKDMRAKYPKHPWPEDPTQADPTLRAKRKKSN